MILNVKEFQLKGEDKICAQIEGAWRKGGRTPFFLNSVTLWRLSASFKIRPFCPLGNLDLCGTQRRFGGFGYKNYLVSNLILSPSSIVKLISVLKSRQFDGRGFRVHQILQLIVPGNRSSVLLIFLACISVFAFCEFIRKAIENT